MGEARRTLSSRPVPESAGKLYFEHGVPIWMESLQYGPNIPSN